ERETAEEEIRARGKVVVVGIEVVGAGEKEGVEGNRCDAADPVGAIIPLAIALSVPGDIGGAGQRGTAESDPKSCYRRRRQQVLLPLLHARLSIFNGV